MSRRYRGAAGETFDEVIKVRDDAQMWMTNVTLQGDNSQKRVCQECAVEVSYRSALYAEGTNVPRLMLSNALHLYFEY